MTLISRTVLFVLALAAAACGNNATPANDAPAPEAAAPAAAGQATLRGDLIKDWQDQKESMLAIAEAMPEEMFGFKPTPAQRSFGEQVMHAAEINVMLLKLVGGQAPAPTFTAETAKTKAEMIQALGQSYDYGIALLNELTDESILATVDADFMGPSTRARLFAFLLGHGMNGYGQMAVYLRLNGVVPPASRGV